MAAVRNTVAHPPPARVPNIAAQLRANHRDPYQLPLVPRPHHATGAEGKPRREPDNGTRRAHGKAPCRTRPGKYRITSTNTVSHQIEERAILINP